VDVPAPPQLAELAAPAPSSSVAEKPEDVVMDSKMLTAVYLSNPKPLYPNVSRRLGEQGTVMLRIFVTIAGDPTEIQLKSSSGYPRLDRAALSAVRNWKFSPATRGNQAVDAWVLVPIRFSLKG
jgi:protein TonB